MRRGASAGSRRACRRSRPGGRASCGRTRPRPKRSMCYRPAWANAARRRRASRRQASAAPGQEFLGIPSPADAGEGAGELLSDPEPPQEAVAVAARDPVFEGLQLLRPAWRLRCECDKPFRRRREKLYAASGRGQMRLRGPHASARLGGPPGGVAVAAARDEASSATRRPR